MVSATNRRKMTPLINCCVWDSKPIMTRPLFSTVYINVPTTMLEKRTFAPPVIGRPPSTAASTVPIESRNRAIGRIAYTLFCRLHVSEVVADVYAIINDVFLRLSLGLTAK